MPSDFRALALSPGLWDVLEELGYHALTPIQARAIPVLLSGKDLVGQSKTGSGKTAAFALPILSKLSLAQREPQALVLCPTRELCAQVARETRKLGRRQAGLRVLVLAGGEPLRAQTQALERGAHVLVGSPGRVLDHLRRGTVAFHALQIVVLDEADRMLEMGFQDDVEQILAATPEARQTVFFSATFPSSIEAMSRKHQRAPQRVSVAEDAEEKLDIRQSIVMAATNAMHDKLGALRWVLEHHPHESALVFANLKATVAELARELAAAGVSVSALHGDLEQRDRDRVLAMFRNKSTRVLIATDVAARGIDIEKLDLVVNFDLPSRPAVYIHRIGRTGRAGRTGIAISLATAHDNPRIADIEQAAGVRLERIKPLARETQQASAQEHGQAAKMDTLRISGGRRQKVRPADILGALTGEAGGLAGSDIGKIEIHDNFSYVAVARSVSRAAQKGLSSGRIKGKKFLVEFAK
jgi:ATP-independent RNA helicase DbpA